MRSLKRATSKGILKEQRKCCCIKVVSSRVFECCRIKSSLLEGCFRVLSGFEARPTCDFERPVAALHTRALIWRADVRKSNASAVCSRAVEAWSSTAFDARRLRSTPEQRFRTPGGCRARPSSDFGRKARPVRCFRSLSRPR